MQANDAHHPLCSRESSARLADAIVMVCGLHTVLDVAAGDGCLTRALLHQGINAFGLEHDGALVARANARTPGRFFWGSVQAMPFASGQFEVVVSDRGLERLDDAEVATALAEMRRVCSRDVFLRLDSAAVDGGGAVRTREWWERKCFEAGFRKHPRYYRLNPYESLNHDNGVLLIALERIPDTALLAYPLSTLEEGRGLDAVDMLRGSGERSDAHVIRYQWACDFIRPNDRVLDAACGLGYGSHVVRALSRAISVTGIDDSDYAVAYANLCYADEASRGKYVRGHLPQALSTYPDASFDAVISFETLGRVEDPRELLKEFQRVLTPGGRVIVSVPDEGAEERRRNPNLGQLHTYDLDRLREEMGSDFDIEVAYAQSAGGSGGAGQRVAGEHRPRELYSVDPLQREPRSAEWWLMVGMKSPFADAPYQERMFEHVLPSGHPSVSYAEEYANPWLGLSMITIGQRASSAQLREQYAADVLKHAPAGSADEGAALCVRAYALLESELPPAEEVDALLARIDRYSRVSCGSRTALRWRVSLAYVKAAILREQGSLEAALDAFVDCARIDAGAFGVHLFTKTTAAWFQAGRLALALGREQQSREMWMQALELGRVLLSVSLEDVLLRPEYPNLFNYGDGIREYVLAWDNLARCANGVHLLANGGDIDVRALDASFSAEYEIVTRDLLDGRAQLSARDAELEKLRMELSDRTQRLEFAAGELVERTNDLITARTTLIERTRRLEVVSGELAERTGHLEAANEQLAQFRKEMDRVRQLLQERTEAMDDTERELQDRARKLEASEMRTGVLEAELQGLRELLVERTEALDLASRDLIERTERLEAANAELAVWVARDQRAAEAAKRDA